MRLRDDPARITSPYLLSHIDNPVQWWAWGDEAFSEARRRDVPLFISIGYAACHWCHVMAHESFEDSATAAILNDNFVCIKVDREERPDVDMVYMSATTALTGQGGWPMSVFTDADGRAFYAGTYFPPDARHGMPSFSDVLGAISSAWSERRADVLASAARIDELLAQAQERSAARVGSEPTEASQSAAVDRLVAEFDHVRGGFGGAPKFPPSMILEFLLRHHRRTGDARALAMVEATCEAMARGGLYDQLAGGFARYSVDAAWVVPHFEKMLYDNALLLRVYLHWWRSTGSPLALRVARETADFIIDDLSSPLGGFISALDADSAVVAGGPAVEGAAYAWTVSQLEDALGQVEGAWAAGMFGVTVEGTFEAGASTLQLPQDPADAEGAERLERVRIALRGARSARPQPARDGKIVAAWNGLAIAGLAEAALLLDAPEYLEAAIAAADVLVSVHLGARGDDRLVRTSLDGHPNLDAPGVLEDYGDVAEGFLALFQVTGDEEWLAFAGVLLDVALSHFREGDAFYDVADDQDDLVRRPMDPTDNAAPSGWGATAGALLSYAAITGSVEHREAATRALGIVGSLGADFPRSVGTGLSVAEALLDGPCEVAVVGAPDDPELRALHRTAVAHASPGQVTVVGPTTSGVPLLKGRERVGGRATAYVCRDFVCRRPVTDPADLIRQLDQRMP